MDEHEHIDLSDSPQMNADQQALFLNITRSKSADSFLGRLLPHPADVPERSLVWELPSNQLTSNIIINSTLPRPERIEEEQRGPGLRVFRPIKKERVRNRCDYDKNICGYITKKIIREFIGKNYEKEAKELMRKYRCDYGQCKTFYLRKVELVTGPSHLPELFVPQASDVEGLNSCKLAFRQFYQWFLKERYLRYLLLEGKMTDKYAYIQYKNTHLFRFVAQNQEYEVPMGMLTRSRSGRKEGGGSQQQ